ncbi:polyprenyl synthetase family protein [Leucobacter sp. wl10]|uniref:polyprenyl synthetase family protein n=1 Tax=Leucobacter sp. wl10 TaxID=2304677 RepID=UPI000E5A67DE|nr:polyprenyl synthetase family protein [Leucobacter sp. wl10]RGE20404.1 polyprenyl synthetase family protein [Leucobacter sp. wl10]
MTELLAVAHNPDRLDEQDVKDEIRKLFDSRSLRAGKYGPLFVSLWKTASQRVTGGKLLRPRLLLGAFEALSATGEHGRAFRAAAVRIAAAVEVLHYSFLLHDDVIDGDLLRRGRSNLIGAVLEERRAQRQVVRASADASADGRDLHWARTSGILMGDMLLSDAHQVFARESLPGPTRIRLLDLLEHTITESIAGEHLDVALCDGVTTPDLETVLAMTRLKTATYTFEMTLKAAAMLAGAARHVEDVVGDVGTRLGSAFQLQDDLLSTFGNASEHGKDAFSDLREGKETAIIAFARTTDRWQKIAPLFGDRELSATDAMQMRTHLSECGAEAFTRALVSDQLHATRSMLDSPETGIPGQLSRFLDQVVQKIEERQS